MAKKLTLWTTYLREGVIIYKIYSDVPRNEYYLYKCENGKETKIKTATTPDVFEEVIRKCRPQ